MIKVAIIGSGPSGLSVLRAFSKLQNKVKETIDITCFEKQNDWGGQWKQTWRTGLDEYGEPVHSSMYSNLWSNGPKECIEFSDYSFEEHFGKSIPSYPPRSIIEDYIIGRAKKSKFRHLIKFNHVVRMVDKQNVGFQITVENLILNKFQKIYFDYLIVATGHFSVPNVPGFDGINSFPGRIMHSHDFRNAYEFIEKDILVVGSSHSAEDIGLQLKKFGARSVTFSYRNKPMGFNWPRGMDEKPLIKSIDGSLVSFQNGFKKSFSAIILCTGYLHAFPFINEDLRLITINRLFSPGLYKGVVWNDYPNLFYIGMQDQWYTFTMFDAEAWYIRDIILKKISLPNKNLRLREMKIWDKRELALNNEYEMIDFQADYIKSLLKETDYPNFNIELTQNEFKTWKKAKEKSIVGYRDSSHISPITGKLSPKYKTSWWNSKDDSVKNFLQ